MTASFRCATRFDVAAAAAVLAPSSHIRDAGQVAMLEYAGKRRRGRPVRVEIAAISGKSDETSLQGR